ncbi:SETMR methyltransferase, partial [Acromyrmex insinuator]
MTTVRYWFNEFERGRSFVFDEERPGRPADVTEKIVEKVHDMILANRRTKVHEIAEAVGMLYGTAFNILHDNLGMKKLSARDCSRWTTSGCGYQFQSMVELRYELHPPYSPDLVPCDFFLFLNLKKWLGGKKFTSNKEVIVKTEAYFVEFDKSYFSEGLKKWQKRWKKCILKGDYVEK